MLLSYTFIVLQAWLNEAQDLKSYRNLLSGLRNQACKQVWMACLVMMTQSLASANRLDLLRCKDYVHYTVQDEARIAFGQSFKHRQPVHFILLHLQFKEHFKSNLQTLIWIIEQCQFLAVLFPCTLSSFLFPHNLVSFRRYQSFISFWHALALWPFPSMHCFHACASQRKQLVGVPSISTHGDITWWFWNLGIGVLSNLKAVSMCFMTFTKSSSGLSGCECCMICIEHVLHSQWREDMFCYKRVQTVLLALVLCRIIKPQRLLCDLLPSMDACHSKGMTRVFFVFLTLTNIP